MTQTASTVTSGAPIVNTAINARVESGGPGGTIIGNSVTEPVGFYGINGVAQTVGYGTPTGPVVLINFPGASATLAQTSAQVAALTLVLKNMGIIGA